MDKLSGLAKNGGTSRPEQIASALIRVERLKLKSLVQEPPVLENSHEQ
ncbi:hypothetical protein [Endozoicomonas arenosclerae]|nr:hypothetical protein [Endozoicomonas arenosclerae]